MDPNRETEDETYILQTDTNENETEKQRTEKGTQDCAYDTKADDSKRTRLLVATDTQSDTNEEERESKWKTDENGESVTSECPVCKAEEEDWDHYDYECRGVREVNERVA